MRHSSKDPRKHFTVQLTSTDCEDGSTVSDDKFNMKLTSDEAYQVARAPENDQADLLAKMFKEKVKKAVTQWFNFNAQDVRDVIDEYCGGYDYDADDGETELDYVLRKFTARCVVHIPEAICGQNGFTFVEEPDVTLEFDYLNSLLGD